VLSGRPNAAAHGREFIGFPIPSAAAMVVSVTLFMMWLSENERELGRSRWILPGLMMLLSVLMVSNVRYPTFKYIDWTLQKHVAAFATLVVVILGIVQFKEVMLAVVFVTYMLYGLVRPWVSKRWRREIEPDEDDVDDDEDEADGTAR
jgi:CDP-diacylglycerol--serine O-phosphatidyltransferase